MAPRAHQGLSLLRQHGFTIGIASITWGFAVEWFARKLGAEHYIGTGLSEGVITQFWPEDKADWTMNLAYQLGVGLRDVVAVGDSDIDLHMLRIVGHPFFVGSNKPDRVSNAVHIPGANINEIAKIELSYR